MNPILAREFRIRFRERYSFLLLFVVATVLGVAAYWIYSDAVFGALREMTTQNSSEIGRDLFRGLVILNGVAWLLVAPALTATGLARERERGLLESLWLSPFRVRSQIGGRYAASLLFLLLLQGATLPVYGIAMLLGGVSPGEVGLCGLIIAMNAIFGAALGLWCSARAYRPMSALTSALGFIVIWTLFAFFGPSLFSSVFIYFKVLWISNFLGVLALPHPLVLLIKALDFEGPTAFFLGYAPSWSDTLTYSFGLGAQLLGTLWLLWRATRIASKPLPDMAWMGRHPYLEKWHTRLQNRKKEREARQEAARVSEKVGGALLYELPLEKLARFRDPLLQREVRGRFRLRQSGIAMALGRLAALFVVVLVWLWMISGLIYPNSRESLGIGLVFLLWFLGALAVGVLASSSLTRERESGTWEGLHLSLLRPFEIVRSKWLSPLVSYAYWSVPISVGIPLSLQWRAGGPGAPIFPMLGAASLVIGSLASVSALGLFISSRLKHSAAATSWTLMGLFALNALLPVAVSNTGVRDYVLETALGLPHVDSRHYNGYSSGYYGTTLSPFDYGAWNRAGAIFDSYSPFITVENVLYLGDLTRISTGTRVLIWLLCLGQTTLLTWLLLQGTRRQIQKTEK